MSMIVTDFVYPVVSVIVDFICVLLCIRFLVRRRSVLWALPLVMSFALLFGSAICIAAAAYTNVGNTAARISSYVAIFIFGLTVIWFITVMAFARRTLGPDTEIARMKKAREEAEYIKRRTVVDERPTAVHKVKMVNEIKVAQKARTLDKDLYTAGPLRTIRTKKSVF